MSNKKTFIRSHITLFSVGAIGILAFIYILLIALNSNDDPNAKKTAITINEDSITLAELNYYVLSAMSYFTSYEASYSQMGYDLWSSMYDDEMTISEYVLQVSIDNVVKDNVLYKEAQALGIELTTEEIQAYKDEISQVWDELTEEEKADYSINKKLLNQVYEKKALADKYYNSIIEDTGIDTEALTQNIKLEDYQQYKYEFLEFPFGDSDSSEVQNYISEEDKADAYETMIEVHDMLATVTDMEAISAEKGTLTYSSATALMGNGTLDSTFENELIPLGINEYSGVFETENGYYIVRKLADTSKMAFADAKEQVIEDAQSEAFNAVYSTMLEKYSITQNTDMINTISIGN